MITEWPDFGEMIDCMHFTDPLQALMTKFYGEPERLENNSNAPGMYFADYDLGPEFHTFLYIVCDFQVHLLHHYEEKTYYRLFTWKEFAYLEEQLRTSLDTEKAFFNLFINHSLVPTRVDRGGVQPIFEGYEYDRHTIDYWPELPSTKQMQIYLKEVVWPYFEHRPESEELEAFINSLP